ncbi:hypothetical protein [Chitinophaga sp. RAB17]|uniref:hypothetical protein n=1 Tax=Chitinophaga sp. RAB17 TaxID=3233049 RepID=UPI003F910A3D
MRKSIKVIIRWGLIISIVAGMKGTISSSQESVFLNRRWYLIDTETKYQQHNGLIVSIVQQASLVFPALKKKVLKGYSRQTVGKYYQSEDGKLMFTVENMP